MQVALGLEDSIGDQAGKGPRQRVARVESRDTHSEFTSLVERREVEDDRRGETSFKRAQHCVVRRDREGCTRYKDSHSRTAKLWPNVLTAAFARHMPPQPSM